MKNSVQLRVLERDNLGKYNFHQVLQEHALNLQPLSLGTLQVNITKLCNQACRHCHVDASPQRTEQMEWAVMERCLNILELDEIENLDITGGAPELNPYFESLVAAAHKLNKHVMVRHNLTVSLDGHPLTGDSKAYLPKFFADHEVEVISSLPYYEPYFTDKQRGSGVFQKSIESMRRLNAEGYGREGNALVLNLVYNPVGAFLPASQPGLEADFKRKLYSDYGLFFNHLYTITNMPINRFATQLNQLGVFDEYMTKLVNAFNPCATEGLMCRSLISVGHDGKLYDCDFNQMLEMQVFNGEPMTVFNFDLNSLIKRKIRFASHCFGCTAGAGSSCGGTTA
jgi:radical SAM/Cys-rich protein